MNMLYRIFIKLCLVTVSLALITDLLHCARNTLKNIRLMIVGLLTFYTLRVTIGTMAFNIQKFCVLPAEFIEVFYMYLGTNSDFAI
jgi:hypothetical protein